MTIHIGLIGGGNITETHARAARAIPGVEIAAIYGTNAEKVARLSGEFGGTPYEDFDALCFELVTTYRRAAELYRR